MHVEVSQHRVGLPPTNELDHVRVDAGAEEHHGAARPQRSCFDIVRAKAVGPPVRHDKVAEKGGHGTSGESVRCAARRSGGKICVDRCIGGGVMKT